MWEEFDSNNCGLWFKTDQVLFSRQAMVHESPFSCHPPAFPSGGGFPVWANFDYGMLNDRCRNAREGR